MRERMLFGPSRLEPLRDSPFARLLAQYETMPVIEQAKGIVMAQQRCGPEEAFDLLRRASQRANIKVRVLAAQIVERTASGNDASNVTPISLGAAKSRHGRTRQARTRLPHPRRGLRPVLDGRTDMLGGANSEPGPPPGRRQAEINTRLDAVRARLKELRERNSGAVRDRGVARNRVEEARRRAAKAHAVAMEVLASGVEAFRHAAEAHERAASMHERVAGLGIGDVGAHERQAAQHRAAAAADWQRAERTQSFLSEPDQAGPAAVSDEPGDGVIP
jgi:ANTAR domain-containing protein